MRANNPRNEMTREIFENAKFGDMFLTAGLKQAVFLRLSENAENKFAVLYVEGWGTIQVFRENGEEVHGDSAYDILRKQSQPSLPSNLDEAANKYANNPFNYGEFVEVVYEFGDPVETIVDDKPFVMDAFKAGAEWMAGQGVSYETSVEDYGDGATVRRPTEIEIDRCGAALCDEVIVQIRKK